jgi:hypothetical protein
MTAIEAKGARCHVSPPFPRNETSLPDRLVIVQVISYSWSRNFIQSRECGPPVRSLAARFLLLQQPRTLLSRFRCQTNQSLFLGGCHLCADPSIFSEGQGCRRQEFESSPIDSSIVYRSVWQLETSVAHLTSTSTRQAPCHH